MSISAQQQKDGNRKLKQWLENDKKVVTYRDISREIACHVNHAKKYVFLIRLADHLASSYPITQAMKLRQHTSSLAHSFANPPLHTPNYLLKLRQNRKPHNH
jgi:hypothetical protein